MYINKHTYVYMYVYIYMYAYTYIYMKDCSPAIPTSTTAWDPCGMAPPTTTGRQTPEQKGKYIYIYE